MSNTPPSQCSPTLSDDKSVLREEFRTLTAFAALLLRFLGGDGKLPPELHSVERIPRLNGRYTRRVLSAVSNVLVRRFEVVAVANYLDAKTIAAMSTDEEGPSSTGFTDFIEPKETSPYHMAMKNWLGWVSDVSKRYFTSMIAVVNPNDRIPGSISSGESDAIEVVKTAAAPSLFDAHADPLDYYMKDYSNAPLEVHLKTVCDFLQLHTDTNRPSDSLRVEGVSLSPAPNHSSSTSPSLDRPSSTINSLSTTSPIDGFMPYIIASSSYKMSRRANHWSSNGYRVLLAALVGPNAREKFNEYFQVFSLAGRFQQTTRRDSYLHEFLLSLDKLSGKSDGSGLISDQLPNFGFTWPSGEQKKAFPSLMDAMRRLSADKSLTVYDVYNGSTAFEFHLLLLSTISGFRWALEQYRSSLTSQSSNAKHLCICAGRSVKNYGTMLWRLTFSQFLEYHLELLEHSTTLLSPIYSNRQQYFDKLCEEDSGSDIDAESSISSESLEPGLLPDDTELTTEPHAKAASIHSWLRLLVAHFSSVSTLSEWARSHPTDVPDCITLVRMAHPKPRTMKCWKAVLNTPGVSSDPEGDTDLIASLIEDSELAVASDGLVKRFREGGPREQVTSVVFTGNRHSEAGLGSLPMPCMFNHTDEPVTEWTFAQIEKFIHDTTQLKPCLGPRFLAVSKLCCPVCWDLLKLLQNHIRPGHAEDRFHVFGCHRTISPVDLPPWLPLPTLKSMVSIYRQRLTDILDKLRVKHGDEPDFGYSDLESDSGYSDSSKHSDPESERAKTNTIFQIGTLDEDVRALSFNPPPS